MQINTSIPFAFEPPQIVNALAAGSQAAAQRNELSRMNALAELYQAQGADILAGQQPALNALAQFDPMAALGVQDARQGMDARALQMDATRQDMDLQLREWAATMDDRERAARLAEGQAVMARIANANTPQAFDALMIEMGKPEMVGQFQMRGQMIDNMRDPLDVLARYDAQTAARQEYKTDSKAAGEEPATVQALRIRAAEAGLQPGSEEYRAFMMSGGVPSQQAQETVVFGADGRPVFIQAPAGTGATLTEGQGKDVVYATRARSALEELDGPEGNANAMASFWEKNAEVLPFGVGRYLQSPEYQTAANSGERFLQAVLRKDTGAAITADETAAYGSVYLPQPGDTAEVLALKRDAREQAVLAIEAGMPPEAILAQGRALIAGGVESRPGTAITGGDATDMPPSFATAPSTLQAIGDTDITPEEIWRYLTPEARRAFTGQTGQ